MRSPARATWGRSSARFVAALPGVCDRSNMSPLSPPKPQAQMNFTVASFRPDTGTMRDVRTHECITNWVAHESEVFSVQFSGDEATCFSMGTESALRQWNVYKTGQKVADFPLHAGCMGPPGFRPVGKLFSLGADSEHILTCAPNSGIIYKEENGSFVDVLSVGNHKSHVVTVDWSLAVDCSTCATASLDGTILVATLFSHV